MAARWDGGPDAWSIETVGGDLSGRHAVVTGANSGIGAATARGLVSLGVDVVLACRNIDAAAEVAEGLLTDFPGRSVEVVQVDLGSLQSVAAAAEQIADLLPQLDLLINNAGVMRSQRTLNDDGVELDFATNFLGHYALTGHLLPRLAAAPAARVVSIGSLTARSGRIHFDDLAMERRYSSSAAYARSKLAQLAFTVELQRRLTAAGSTISALAAHPGSTRTRVLRERGPILRWLYAGRSMRWLSDYAVQDADHGAAPTLRAALDPQALGGQYFGPSGRLQLTGAPVPVEMAEAAHDPDLGRRLWQVAEELSGVCYDFDSL